MITDGFEFIPFLVHERTFIANPGFHCILGEWSAIRKLARNGLGGKSQLEVERVWEKCGIDLLEADFWPGISSG